MLQERAESLETSINRFIQAAQPSAPFSIKELKALLTKHIESDREGLIAALTTKCTKIELKIKRSSQNYQIERHRFARDLNALILQNSQLRQAIDEKSRTIIAKKRSWRQFASPFKQISRTSMDFGAVKSLRAQSKGLHGPIETLRAEFAAMSSSTLIAIQHWALAIRDKLVFLPADNMDFSDLENEIRSLTSRNCKMREEIAAFPPDLRKAIARKSRDAVLTELQHGLAFVDCKSMQQMAAVVTSIVDGALEEKSDDIAIRRQARENSRIVRSVRIEEAVVRASSPGVRPGFPRRGPRVELAVASSALDRTMAEIEKLRHSRRIGKFGDVRLPAQVEEPASP
jgi:hypothetical protein